MRSVIEMAREAGIEFTYDPTETPVRAFVECWEDEMQKFADLIRADEREACAKVCETKGAIKYAGLTIGEQCAATIRSRGSK